FSRQGRTSRFNVDLLKPVQGSHVRGLGKRMNSGRTTGLCPATAMGFVVKFIPFLIAGNSDCPIPLSSRWWNPKALAPQGITIIFLLKHLSASFENIIADSTAPFAGDPGGP